MKTEIKSLFFLPMLRAALGLTPAGQVTAQTFTTLYNFTATSANSPHTNSDGAYPQACFVLTNNTLYGTAQNGGDFGNGTAFAINTDGTGFTNLHNFTLLSVPNSGTNSDGALPKANLILLGNTLYGTAVAGGNLNAGTVFAVNTDGTGFTNLHNFNNDGTFPNGLILSGNTLYGTAFYGGTFGRGTVFKINTDGTSSTNLHNFTGVSGPQSQTNSEGASPSAKLTLSGNTLYGTAEQPWGSSVQIFEIERGHGGLTAVELSR